MKCARIGVVSEYKPEAPARVDLRVRRIGKPRRRFGLIFRSPTVPRSDETASDLLKQNESLDHHESLTRREAEAVATTAPPPGREPRIMLIEQGPTKPKPPAVVFTVGHSNRTLEEFLALLRAHGVALVVDVRKMPRSRKNPQFNIDALPQSLRDVGIGYVHLPDLGGLRRRDPNSPNTGWRNASFRAYADYMLTPEFERGLQEFLKQASERTAALMCAEAVPWRCHRSLIADALTARGVSVMDILSASRAQPHLLRPWAHVEGARITYPPAVEEAHQES